MNRIYLIHYLVKKTFHPNFQKYDQFSILELYPSSADLIRDRFGTIFESKRLQPKEFTPNIDHSLLALDTTVENTLHSYFMLFCRRCHRYDCFLHKDKPVTPNLNIQSKNSNIIYRPCHSHCYRRKPSTSSQQKRRKIELKRSRSELIDNKIFKTPVKNGFYSTRMKSEEISTTIDSHIYQNGFLLKPSLKRKFNDEISHWLSSEKSLFRVFSMIFGDNICMIANLIDKPCSQVYTFYFNEKKLFLQKQLLTINASDSIDMKINGEYKTKKINGLIINTNDEEEMKMCNGNDNQQSVRIYWRFFLVILFFRQVRLVLQQLIVHLLVVLILYHFVVNVVINKYY